MSGGGDEATEKTEQTEVGSSFKGHCCAMKHYYCTKQNIVEKLDIEPRVIICKQKLKISQTYQQRIVVKNCGMYTRRLKYCTDSPVDTTVRVEKSMRGKDLHADQIVIIDIQIRPKSRKNINRRRHIFILSEHPNIIFEVPIVGKSDVPSIPQSIQFPGSVLKSTTYYEFVIYNSSVKPNSVTIKSSFPKLKIIPSSNKIPKKDFIKVLLKLSVFNMKIAQDEIKLKFANASYISLPFRHQPILNTLYMSDCCINFEELKFERQSQKEFSVCNECSQNIHYNVKFLTDIEELEDLPLDGENETDDEVEIIPRDLHSMVSEMGSKEFVKKSNTYKEKFNITAMKHFTVNSKGGLLKSNSSNTFTVIFQPIMGGCDDLDDNENAPFFLKTKIIFVVMDELYTDQKSVIVTGLVSGPDVQFTPKILDTRRIYLGEEHCERISVLNIDGLVNATVYFKDYSPDDMTVCVMSPSEGFYLEPCRRGVFVLKLFTRVIGKFLVKLRFKVKCGSYYYVTLKGQSQHVHVKMYPDIIEFGSVPVAVPQKRHILLMNPLSVPMTLHCRPAENGRDTPLTLNILVDEMLPVTVINPVKQLEHIDDEYPPDERFSKDIDVIEKESSQTTFRSICETCDISSYSTEFEEDILDEMENLSYNVVCNIKRTKPFEKPEVECRILQEAVNSLLSINYFQDFQYSNYKLMDWNALPTDPCELYVDSEIIHLKPNTGRSITVLLIPNNLGYSSRAIEIRCCPINEFRDDDDEQETNTLVDSTLMTSKLWVEYNCRVPIFEWLDTVDFNDRITYAGEEYLFEMYFENTSNVGGFLYYHVVPGSEKGEMFFTDNTWKFYVGPLNYCYANCCAIFKTLGDIKLSGIIKYVGQQSGIPFHVLAHALPMRISLNPKTINVRQNVLVYSRIYIYIDNLTPTRTWFTAHLRNDNYQCVEPMGCILAPTGQGVYLTLHTKYYDPEVYKNILHISILFGNDMEIPIIFNIEGMPIFFEPNIKEGLDAGVILTNSEENFYADIPKFSKDIKVINRGERCYRLIIHKLKSSIATCAVPQMKARLNVTPKAIMMLPGTEDYIHITANACEEAIVYNEFRIQIIDQTNKKRFMNIRFVATAKFIYPDLTWSRKEITMVYRRTHRFMEHLNLELVELINTADVDIENVNLKVIGPFKIKALFEHPFRKELDFVLVGMEHKELTIMLNKSAIMDKFCTHVDGRIICIANNKPQKSLILRVNILNPELKITPPELILFTRFEEATTILDIENVGCLEAKYKWKKLKEFVNYVDEADYELDFAREILSDIFHILELSDDIISDDEKEYTDDMPRRNMTERYQNYRCKLMRLQRNDPIGVKNILNDLIDNLDLEHKRYLLRLDETALEECVKCPDDLADDATSYVECTLDQIVNALQIEDSYEISDPSSDPCDRERTIYFVEKSGILSQAEKKPCILHLPPVHKGYAHEANFQLDVVGGTSMPLKVILVNLQKTVELSRKSIYLGIKPWYEVYHTSVKIQNVTQYVITLGLDILPAANKKKRHRLSDGYVEIANVKYFNISAKLSKTIKLNGIMGFSDEFIREIKITINDGEELRVRLRGQGIMPIFSVTSDLARIEQLDSELVNEYELLRRIYQFDIFKSITEEDDEVGIDGEEGADESVKQYSEFSLISGSSVSSRTIERRFYKLMQTYVMVYKNDQLPNATILEQLMETEKFLEQLSYSTEARSLLQMVYQNYVKELKIFDEKMPLNVKHFTVQPLPFELHGYVLNMNELKINQFRKYEINLHFFGPGILIAAARTAVKIPGLVMDFDVEESRDDQEFIFYSSTDHKAPDFYDKPYRNMHERIIDLETDPKLKHAHSFDVDEHLMAHQRDISTKERRNIKNYYNSLNKSVYMEHKHHYVLCKIYTKSKTNFSGTNLRVVFLIKPQMRFYEDGQMIEDYVYIDLHMGPTLPILLRGMISHN